MIDNLYKIYLEYPHVSTDTRKIEPNSIFFALKGPNFNANKFAAEALDKGAAYAVVDEEEYALDDRFILVENVLTALQELATHHRKQLRIPIIGLTGSNGKTTTKELIAAVLSTKYNVLYTEGNLNNHIGVPLTLLKVTEAHEIAIIEMGANHQGEIALLSSIALPSHGFITNIGKAHLEGFGGIEGVIKGKTELYQHLINYDGVVWINSANPILSNMTKRFKDPLLYPQKGDFYHCEFLDADPNVRLKTESGATVQTQLVGAYNFENIAVALCIGKYFQVPAQDAELAVATYNPTNNRSQIIKKGSNTIILDAYNANPTSMLSALENLTRMEGGNKVVILGDMKELGDESEDEHSKIGEFLQNSDISKVFLFGPEMVAAADKVMSSYHTDKKQLLDAVQNTTLENALILIKGSRSMGLEATLDVL